MRKSYFIILIFGIVLGLYLRDILNDEPVAAKIVTIRSRNLEYQVETRAETVGELANWIPDQVRDDKLKAGMVINIEKPLSITIRDGGEEPQTIITTVETVDDFLREQKIGLALTDRVIPGENTFLTENLVIQIDRIVDLEITEHAEIPFTVNLEHDPSSYYGHEEILTAGRNGENQQKFLITYENGVEIKRRLLSESILREPVVEQRRLGTRVEVELTEEGRASWYAYKACLCAAHPNYMKGRYVRVTAVNSNKSIIVRINDWGPDRSIFPDRVIDLDAVAFKLLASLGAGTIEVKAELLR